MSVCGETTIYSSAMGDVLLERECTWLIRIPTTDAYVTLPPNFWQVWGYPHKGSQNIKFVPIFLLVTSHFMFWAYQSLKRWGVVGGCMVSDLWTNRLMYIWKQCNDLRRVSKCNFIFIFLFYEISWTISVIFMCYMTCVLKKEIQGSKNDLKITHYLFWNQHKILNKKNVGDKN